MKSATAHSPQSRAPLPLLAGLPALIFSLLLMGSCTATPNHLPATETDTHTAAGTEELRAHYEALLTELRAELLAVRQEQYMTRIDYEARIAALEAALADLDDTPTSADSTPITSVDTAIPTETTPSAPVNMAFRYGMEDGQAVIYEYLGTETVVTIPAAIEGYPVVRIADRAFADTAIQAVTIPSSVTHIGWFAFANCSALETVTLPPSITRIDYAAFQNCPRLTLRCYADTYAARYAISFGLPHETI